MQHLGNYQVYLAYKPELMFGDTFQYDNRVHVEFAHLYHWHPFNPDEFDIQGTKYNMDDFLFNAEPVVKHGMKDFVDSMSRGLAGRVSESLQYAVLGNSVRTISSAVQCMFPSILYYHVSIHPVLSRFHPSRTIMFPPVLYYHVSIHPVLSCFHPSCTIMFPSLLFYHVSIHPVLSCFHPSRTIMFPSILYYHVSTRPVLSCFHPSCTIMFPSIPYYHVSIHPVLSCFHPSRTIMFPSILYYHVSTRPVLSCFHPSCTIMFPSILFYHVFHNYHIHFNFHGIYILCIMAFSTFCVFIFMDGHVLPLHNSLIQIFAGVNCRGWLPIRKYREYQSAYSTHYCIQACLCLPSIPDISTYLYIPKLSYSPTHMYKNVCYHLYTPPYYRYLLC